MSERDVIELLAETRDWLREVQIGDAVPAIDAGIAEIASLRAEVERLRAAKTNHDAAPAAKATLHAADHAVCGTATSGGGTGDTTRDPVDVPATWQDECADVEAAFARSGVRPTWPDDEPGNPGPMANAMADEITRLRAEVERRRLTGSERISIGWGADLLEQRGNWQSARTLRNLLARLGGAS